MCKDIELPSQTDIVRASEAARLTGVKLWSLRRWARDGRIGHAVIDGKHWYRVSEIEAAKTAGWVARTLVPMPRAEDAPAPTVSDWRASPLYRGVATRTARAAGASALVRKRRP